VQTAIDVAYIGSWNDTLVNQAANSLWLAHSNEETRARQCSATVATLIGIAPKHELEGMIAARRITLLWSVTGARC
jgi:hypothetical protein